MMKKELSGWHTSLDCYDKETLSCNTMLNIACLLLGKSSAHDCYPTNKPSVSAVLFGCHGINLLKNLVSRELLRILENFHFSIWISKHFDFTFHFLKKSEGILISLCTSRKRVKAFDFHFALLEKEWKLFIFTFHFSNFKNPLSLVPAMLCQWNLTKLVGEIFLWYKWYKLYKWCKYYK